MRYRRSKGEAAKFGCRLCVSPDDRAICGAFFFSSDVNRLLPNKTALVLASIACALVLLGIALNYFLNGEVRYVHVLFALGLLAYVVWFSGRREPEE